MTMNTINASVFEATRRAIAIKKSQVDDIDIDNGTDWNAEAKALMYGIFASPAVDFKKYLVAERMYDVATVELAEAAIGTLESSIPDFVAHVIDPSHDLSVYAPEKPDAHIVEHIIGKLNLTPAPQLDAAGAAKPTRKVAAVNSAMTPAINSLLNAASAGKYTDIMKILETNEELAEALGATKAELASALMKARAPHVPTTGKVAVAAGELTYEVVDTEARKVFTMANGKSTKTTKGLAFTIPTLVWKDAAGNVVVHPEVPDVDENYDFDGIKLLQFLTGLTLGMNQWLFGHTGTGKTTFVEQVAARMGWPCLRINLDANLERADIVGHVALTEKGGTTITKFEEGILPHAMQRPGFLIMDEIDAGRPDILFCVQKALESRV